VNKVNGIPNLGWSLPDYSAVSTIRELFSTATAAYFCGRADPVGFSIKLRENAAAGRFDRLVP